ncbi:MAG: c-type cytochrome [Chloroflexi bacterium]|nr:c-type cytochrome [Chloroflexota bacterium]
MSLNYVIMNHLRVGAKPALVVLLTLLSLIFSLFFTNGSSGTVSAQAGPTGAAYRGERIFREHCTQCHGQEGRGDGPISSQAPVPLPDFTDPAFVQTRSPEEIHAFIAEGSVENLMPPWKDTLDDGQIWDATAYVWSLHLSESELAQAATLYEADCAQCHGENGEGSSTDPVGPSLTGTTMLSQSEQALREAVLADSHPSLDTISEQDITLAMVGARAFSLGFRENKPSLNGEGTLIVSVKNGTTGEIMPGLPVRLIIFENEAFSDMKNTESDDNGELVLSGLPTDSSWAYVVEVVYDNVPYDTDLIQFDPGTTSLDVPVLVYEPGASIDDIRVNRAHWVISFNTPNQVDVGELYALSNTGDRVYTGEGSADTMPPQVLRFVFPEDAINLGVEGGDASNRYIIQDNEIIDTLPFAPGKRQILFRYTLPVVDGKVTLGHALTYPIDYLNLLVPDVGVKVDAPAWTVGDPLPTQSGDYLNYIITEQPAGASPVTTLSEIKPEIATANMIDQQTGRQVVDANATPGISAYPFLPWIIAVFGVVFLAVATMFVIQRQRAFSETLPQVRARFQEDLLEQIAQLDDAFEEGRISRSDYEEQRQLLKSQLATLLKEESS